MNAKHLQTNGCNCLVQGFEFKAEQKRLTLVSKKIEQRTAKKLRIYHTAALERLMTSEHLDGHNTIVGKPLGTITRAELHLKCNKDQSQKKNNRVRPKKTTMKKSQHANLDGSKSFKNETRRARAKVQTSVDEFRKSWRDGRVAASTEYTVFLQNANNAVDCRCIRNEVTFGLLKCSSWMTSMSSQRPTTSTHQRCGP